MNNNIQDSVIHLRRLLSALDAAAYVLRSHGNDDLRKSLMANAEAVMSLVESVESRGEYQTLRRKSLE